MMAAEKEMIERTTQRLSADCNIATDCNVPTEIVADKIETDATIEGDIETDANIENEEITAPVTIENEASKNIEIKSISGDEQAIKEKEDKSENLLDLDEMMDNMEDDI